MPRTPVGKGFPIGRASGRLMSSESLFKGTRQAVRSRDGAELGEGSLREVTHGPRTTAPGAEDLTGAGNARTT